MLLEVKTIFPLIYQEGVYSVLTKKVSTPSVANKLLPVLVL